MTPQQKKLVTEMIVENSFYLLLSMIALITLFFISAARVHRIIDNYSKISVLKSESESLNRRRLILSEAKEADIIAYNQTFTKLIPQEDSIISVYRAVETFARNSGLTIQKMSTPVPNTKSEITKVSFTTQVPLDSFLRKIENYLILSNRLMTIHSIKYNATQSTFDIEASYHWKSKVNTKNTQIKQGDWQQIKNIHQQFLQNNVKISK